MRFTVYAELVSDVITESLEQEYVQHQTSPQDFIDRRYQGQGGCSVTLNSDSDLAWDDSPFSQTEVDFDEDPPVVDFGSGHPELIECYVVEDGGWEVEFSAVVDVTLNVEARDEQSARDICMDMIPKLFTVFERFSSYELAVIEIRNLQITPAE